MASWDQLKRYVKSNYNVSQEFPDGNGLTLEFRVDEGRTQLAFVTRQLLMGGTEDWAVIDAAYGRRGQATVRAFFSRVTVVPIGPCAFRVESTIGDTGEVTVRPGLNCSVVEASTTELYVGTHPKAHFSRGSLGLGSAITHGLYKLFGIAPYAAKMKRFQQGIERRIARQ